MVPPSGSPAERQQLAGYAAKLEAGWSDRAAAFAVPGSPGTKGRMHHHLRRPPFAGWLMQGAGGSYEVPAARTVPLLACLVAAGS